MLSAFVSVWGMAELKLNAKEPTEISEWGRVSENIRRLSVDDMYLIQLCAITIV